MWVYYKTQQWYSQCHSAWASPLNTTRIRTISLQASSVQQLNISSACPSYSHYDMLNVTREGNREVNTVVRPQKSWTYSNQKLHLRNKWRLVTSFALNIQLTLRRYTMDGRVQTYLHTHKVFHSSKTASTSVKVLAALHFLKHPRGILFYLCHKPSDEKFSVSFMA